MVRVPIRLEKRETDERYKTGFVVAASFFGGHSVSHPGPGQITAKPS